MPIQCFDSYGHWGSFWKMGYAMWRESTPTPFMPFGVCIGSGLVEMTLVMTQSLALLLGIYLGMTSCRYFLFRKCAAQVPTFGNWFIFPETPPYIFISLLHSLSAASPFPIPLCPVVELDSFLGVIRNNGEGDLVHMQPPQHCPHYHSTPAG